MSFSTWRNIHLPKCPKLAGYSYYTSYIWMEADNEHNGKHEHKCVPKNCIVNDNCVSTILLASRMIRLIVQSVMYCTSMYHEYSAETFCHGCHLQDSLEEWGRHHTTCSIGDILTQIISSNLFLYRNDKWLWQLS